MFFFEDIQRWLEQTTWDTFSNPSYTVLTKIFQLNHLSSDQKPCDIPLYWLVYRDPYNGLL